MPDLVIKPTTTSGNKLILKDQAGGAVLTTADSGATLGNSTQDNITRLGTVTVGNLSNAAIVYPAGHVTGWTQTVTTPVATQGNQADYTEMTGSSVDYTPTTGSSYVVYEYVTVMSNSDDQSVQLFWFNHDGSDVANTNFVVAQFGNANEASILPFKFVLPSWSGSKNCRLMIHCSNTANSTGKVHKSTYSGDSSSTDVYVKIYRTTYSVM